MTETDRVARNLMKKHPPRHGPKHGRRRHRSDTSAIPRAIYRTGSVRRLQRKQRRAMADSCWHETTHAGVLGNTLPLARATPITVTTAAGKSEVDSQRHMAYAVPQPRHDVVEFVRSWQQGRHIAEAYHAAPAHSQCRSIGRDALSRGTARTATLRLISPRTQRSSQ